MPKKFLFLLFFVNMAAGILHASHIVGGDIRYTCLGNNQYAIDLTVYRDCEHGQPFFDNPAYVAVYTGTGTLFQNLALNYNNVDTVPLAGNGPCGLPPHGLCVDVGHYYAEVNLPFNLNGYQIVYQRCCRNEIVDNIEFPEATGATFSIFLSADAQLVCNSSPAWKDYPPVVICLGQALNFDHSASDLQGDQIVYSFCEPSQGGDTLMPYPNPPPPPPYVPVVFTGGYSSANPMGGNPVVQIDPLTGVISGTPDRLGHFVLGICAQEFRNGVLLSESRRDIEFIVSSCNQSILEVSLNQPAFVCDLPLTALDPVVKNGTPPYSYLWSTGATTSYLVNVTPGNTYTVTVSDAAGCTTAVNIQGYDCVWPGDANYDGVANNEDVLTIGLFHGDGGPVRPNASNSWTAQPAPFWNDIQTTGVNTKHVDCDGDGSINVFDVDPVALNYSQVHPTAFHPGPQSGDAPPLSVELIPPYFSPGKDIVVSVSLGTKSQLAEDVYGLMYTIECDHPAVLDANAALKANFDALALGDVNHSLRLAYPLVNQSGQEDVAVCNIQRKSLAPFYGNMGQFTYRLASTAPGVPVTFSLTNVKLINAKGEVLPVKTQNAVLGTSATGEPFGGIFRQLAVSPNPAEGQVTLSASVPFGPSPRVEVFDSNGRLVLEQTNPDAPQASVALNVATLSPGFYWVRVQTREGVFVGKMAKQ